MPKTKKKKSGQPITKRERLPGDIQRGPILIRKFHTLQTAISRAVTTGDAAEQAQLEDQLQDLGGLEMYQKASIRGQDKRRGGDSSKTLVEWLKSPDLDFQWPADKARVLEIGSLSTDNYISRFAKLDVSRIDLNSQEPAILQQNFLDRPDPESKVQQFEGISCSLVLNFVPLMQRSDFLVHLTKFLPVSDRNVTRWLFFVMPAPCINNSRYMDKALLLRILQTLGFEKVKEKITDRIAYWLFKRVAELTPGQIYKKAELQGGKTRNNFFIPLKT
ncbi:Putative uncharacterized protein [Taphrina deformans PYCC 5710]|uniref:25S rRNA adenine-N(1) methyltransferase n=1 Tax=Taphrina deformans (strain PYCC 5710 / ATCC 11124 / CBS 356.35 / IMI 108563 / JCM 9778 / NBRC 8474) TaxID=1097556 RepID=R4X7P7_TAPDE|nr:Putative uncharacterized protein [Taphrina deformans PYCC 5710]|eukprot:CCG81193.1 Putative uncharacterized protein [Taphrina deformans PYCC 5710]